MIALKLKIAEEFYAEAATVQAEFFDCVGRFFAYAQAGKFSEADAIHKHQEILLDRQVEIAKEISELAR